MMCAFAAAVVLQGRVADDQLLHRRSSSLPRHPLLLLQLSPSCSALANAGAPTASCRQLQQLGACTARPQALAQPQCCRGADRQFGLAEVPQLACVLRAAAAAQNQLHDAKIAGTPSETMLTWRAPGHGRHRSWQPHSCADCRDGRHNAGTLSAGSPSASSQERPSHHGARTCGCGCELGVRCQSWLLDSRL